MTTMLVLGSDRISAKALDMVQDIPSLIIVLDGSTCFKRIAKLVWKKRLSLILVLKMVIFELRRPVLKPPKTVYPVIRNNFDLLRLLEDHHPERVILFNGVV